MAQTYAVGEDRKCCCYGPLQPLFRMISYMAAMDASVRVEPSTFFKICILYTLKTGYQR